MKKLATALLVAFTAGGIAAPVLVSPALACPGHEKPNEPGATKPKPPDKPKTGKPKPKPPTA